MIKLTSILAAVLIFSSAPVAEAAMREVILPPQHVFIPNGFDSNDRSEVVMHGYFPNTCYRAAHASARISQGKIVVTNTAYYEDNSPCMEMMVPWTSSVSTGVLAPGNYNVLVQQKTATQKLVGTLPIAFSKSNSIDDHLYAYVNGFLVNKTGSRVSSITIAGSFSMTCMYLKEVLVQQDKDVVTVLPIVEINSSKTCAHTYAPIAFKKTINVNVRLSQRETLFHVRSLNGQALNYVETNVMAVK